MRLVLSRLILLCLPVRADWEVRPEWGDWFAEQGVTGTLLVHAHGDDRRHVHAPQRARAGFIPASTFKLFSALVAFVEALAQGPVPFDAAVRKRYVASR